MELACLSPGKTRTVMELQTLKCTARPALALMQFGPAKLFISPFTNLELKKTCGCFVHELQSALQMPACMKVATWHSLFAITAGVWSKCIAQILLNPHILRWCMFNLHQWRSCDAPLYMTSGEEIADAFDQFKEFELFLKYRHLALGLHAWKTASN